MFNRITIGAIIVILLAGGIYFAILSRESERAFRAANQTALAKGMALAQERKERERLQEELKRVRTALGELRNASANYEGEILDLREKLGDLSASLSDVEETKLVLMRERRAKAALEKMLHTQKEKLGTQEKKLAAQGKQMEDQKKLLREWEEKLQEREVALSEERKKGGQLARALSGFETDVQKLQKAVAGKSAAADEYSRKLVMMKSSLSKLDEQRRAAKARALRESQRAQKLRASLEALKMEISNKEISLQETRNMVRIDIVSKFLFDIGSAEVRAEGREALDKLVGFFKEQEDKIIRVEGHTDNQPIRGRLAKRFPTNWELSSARAISVVRYLQGKGIPPERLSATGYSFYRGEASNETAEGRAKNRRIVILISRNPEFLSARKADQ